MNDDSDVREQLANTPFAEVADTHEELDDADDDDLVRLVYAYARDETDEFELDSLSSWSYAVFELRERGYVVDKDSAGEMEIRTADGDVIAPTDVFTE